MKNFDNFDKKSNVNVLFKKQNYKVERNYSNILMKTSENYVNASNSNFDQQKKETKSQIGFRKKIAFADCNSSNYLTRDLNQSSILKNEIFSNSSLDNVFEKASNNSLDRRIRGGIKSSDLTNELSKGKI